jgi:hypothetical protein
VYLSILYFPRYDSLKHPKPSILLFVGSFICAPTPRAAQSTSSSVKNKKTVWTLVLNSLLPAPSIGDALGKGASAV